MGHIKWKDIGVCDVFLSRGLGAMCHHSSYAVLYMTIAITLLSIFFSQ